LDRRTRDGRGGNVLDFMTSSDSQWVVHGADQDEDERFELFLRPIDGSGDPIRVNDTLIAGATSSDHSSSRPTATASCTSPTRERRSCRALPAVPPV